jgi:dihydrofolate reductase
MPKLRVHSIATSVDGFAAGSNQSLDNPMGEGGRTLHPWVFATKYGKTMTGQPGGETGIDNDFLERGDENIGAHIMGRNMFGPIRGEWTGDWRGWWGDEPPYHHSVFVLTHYAHAPIEMEGGTTFFFVTDGIEAALKLAFEAADGKDVRIGGGTSTIQQYLRAQLVDEMHIAFVPTLLGSGERLFEGIDMPALGYECVEFVASPNVAHIRFARAVSL